MTRTPALRVTLTVLVLMVTAALAGCGTSSPSAGSSGHGTPSANGTPTAIPTPKGGMTANPPKQGSGEVPNCTLDQLDIVYSPTDNSAGHAHGVLTFGNSGSSDCELTGFATVTFVNPEAEQAMGAPAGHDASHPVAPAVASVSGFSTADLTITDASLISGCTVVTATALLVTAPGQSDARNVPIPPTPACQENSIGLLQVSANYIPPGS